MYFSSSQSVFNSQLLRRKLNPETRLMRVNKTFYFLKVKSNRADIKVLCWGAGASFTKGDLILIHQEREIIRAILIIVLINSAAVCRGKSQQHICKKSFVLHQPSILHPSISLRVDR